MPTGDPGYRSSNARLTSVPTESALGHGEGVTATAVSAANTADILADVQLQELQRRDLLMRAVTAGIAEILTAGVIKDVLPGVLEEIGKVARIDRLLVIEEPPRHGDMPKPYYRWMRAGVAARANLYEASIDSPRYAALLEWLRPVRKGKAVFASRNTSTGLMLELLDVVQVTSLLLVPIMVKGRHWGSVSFDDCHSEREWMPDEVNALHLFANLIGVAVTRERSIEEVRNRDELLRAVTLSAGEIISAPYLHEAISHSLEKVARAMRSDRMLVLEVVPSAAGPQLLHRNSWHAPQVSLELETALRATAGPGAAEYLAWTQALQRGEPIRGIYSQVSGALREYFEKRALQSTLIVPIMVDGHFWGQISFDACREEREWSADDLDILKTLAGLIGTAIKRERYIEELTNAKTIIQNSPTILYRLRGEPSFPMMYVSQNVALLGYSAEGLLESPTLYQSYVHPEDRARVQTAMVTLLRPDASATTVEYRMLTSKGESRWMESRYSPVRDTNGRLVEVEGIMIDVTERKLAEEKIARLARTDVLTGLANRGTFNDRLRQAVAGVQRGSDAFAVLYLDLDRFKEINDTLGHPTGDRLLQLAAERLRALVRESDLVARLGGDEFAVLQGNVPEAAAAGALATKIIEVLSAPYAVDGQELRVGASVGISVYGSGVSVTGADELLAQADQALYRSKEAGRGRFHFHTAELDRETRERVSLAEDLRGALDRDELELYYQPQVELSSGRVTGMEALIRWNHPQRGLLVPDTFLSIAEKCGLMQSLGRWVLDRACRQLREWRDRHISVPLIAVNVGLAQVRAGRELLADVKRSLARWQLQPSDLELDVTELILARTTLAQSSVLEELHKLGVRIAIDDFGTKYSSLDYLRTYHVSRLKIARPMVAAAASDQSGAAVVRAIMSLAGELGVEVIAEGVETEAQRNQLVQLGAHTKGQGFLFSAPAPAAEALQVLREYSVRD